MGLLYAEESYIIRGLAFDIYKLFRNNHKEVIYQNAFFLGLKQKGSKIDREKRISVYYENKKIGSYMPDLIVNDNILIELKVKPRLNQDDIKQFWYYLKGSELRLGFLINFGSASGVEIIRRVYDTARNKNLRRGSACSSA